MKSTFLLFFFALTVGICQAQNSPCNITKLDWQTAFTSDEGTVSYFMESSDCKGKEICGQPKIGLKHSFKKPIWIKVKLKGFNCDNQTIVAEFYTNRTYITANEVYVAKHNWHTFKAISEVVNVEVAYEQTTVQSMIYNKDGNTLDTYVDGKYQKKAPSAEELKSTVQDSAKKAQLLATAKTSKQPTAQQEKKMKNIVQAPLKNGKKATSKAAVAQNAAPKQDKKTNTNVAPPSVKSTISEQKTTTKAADEQKTVDNQVGNQAGNQAGKSVVAEATPSVKKANTKRKSTKGTTNGQRTASKPVETTVLKNTTPPVKTENKTSVPAATTTATATQEALKKATEPTVTEASTTTTTPSVKTEKTATDQAFVQPPPVVQPSGTKATNAAVIAEASPSVKPKNAPAPSATNQVANQTAKPAANQAAKPAANQATKPATGQIASQTTAKNPTDKSAERPQAYMPAAKTQKTVDAVKPPIAPVIIEPENTPLNVLKSNVLYPLSLGYEHGLGKHFSIFANGFFMPALSFNSTKNSIRSVKLMKPSVGFAAEARYYISKEKAPLNGVYWGGFFTSRSADIAINTVTLSPAGTSDATITIPLGLQMYGLMLGKQKIRAKGFTTDFGIGVGSYNLFGVPNISPNAEGIFGRIGELTKNKTGVAPRVNVNLGYAF